MRGIARLAMRGPTVAAAMVALFALVALVFAPALLISGGVVALATLRQGPAAGIRVMAVAGVLMAAAILALFGRFGVAAAVTMVAWLPTWAAAVLLRRTGDQGLALTLIGFAVTAYGIWMRLAFADVDEFWRGRLEALGASVKAQGGQFLNAEEITLVGNMMHEASLGIACVALAAMVMLARWWQASLYNPGGFRTEFQALVLPRWLTSVAGLIAIAGLVLAASGSPSAVAGDLIVVLVVLFAFQGLAVIHERVVRQRLHTSWLVGMYLLLLFIPHIVATVLAATGIADVVGDFRGLRRPGN